MKKGFLLMSVLVGLTFVFLTGCDTVDFVLKNAELCSIINCDQVGIVDITGPNNPLVPNQPDYDKDPTCTLPGLCGPNPWYPYSTAPDAGEPATAGT
jgi:hypothetical protein